MNNSAADTNVLTKSDSESNFPINFQPMPKRFMVWDTVDKEFIIINHKGKVGTIEDIVREFQYNPYLISQCSIIQSTNLLDKDSKEIFEGGIVDYNGDGELLGIVVFIDGQWQLKDKNGNLMFLKGMPHQKLVGHILSNPELLEEKNV